MSPTAIHLSSAPVVLGPSRRRETPPPAVSFRKVVEGGAKLLVSGAQVAGSIVGGPFLAAGLGAAAAAATRTSGGSPQSGDLSTLGVGGQTSADPLSTLQSQRMNDELKLLALQEQIQRSNRQIALVSNVMKARHDTAKAAISNIRS